MRKGYKRLIAFALSLFLLALMPVWVRPCVTSAQDGTLVLILSGNPFSISYTHSVNKSRVEDFYTVAGGKLVMQKTHFTSYGAGIPEPDLEAGELFSVQDDYIEISNMNRQLPALVLQTGVTADHHITDNGKEYVLNDYIPPQTRIIITVRRVSTLEALLHIRR